ALVAAVKAISSDTLLEQLIYEKVFHHNRRLQYVYVCGVCGYPHKAEKSTEDYGQCKKCMSNAVRATQHLRGWTRQHPTGCSKSEGFAQEVVDKMRSNYSQYFGMSPWLIDGDADLVVFKWKKGLISAEYIGGDVVEERTTPKALCKAALLVPFIWDGSFDWKTVSFRPSCRLSPLLPTIFEFVQRGVTSNG